MQKILLVEDDRDIVENLAEFLRKEGYAVKSAIGQSSVLAILEDESFDLVLLDISLADGDASESPVAAWSSGASL